MKIKLLNVNEFIQKNTILPVTSIKAEGLGGKPDIEGLFSEEIFGRLGSNQRRQKFGYIDLKLKVIHPEVWELVLGLNPDIKKIVMGKKRVIIDSNGMFVEDPSGNTGLSFLIESLTKINILKVGKDRPEKAKFVKKNLDIILIDKLLVLPAGIRDMQISKSSGKTFKQSAEINMLYSELISQVKVIPDDSALLPEDLLASITGSIQRKVNEISDWIRNKQIKGKSGLIRGGMLSKTVDYTGRLVIAGDPKLPLGYVGLPWQVCLKLYEPFFEKIIFKDSFSEHIKELIKQQQNRESDLDSAAIKKFLSNINEHPETVSPLLKDELIKIIEDIVKDKVILFKRDPVESRDSWIAADIRIDKNGYVAKINPLDCKRNGADFDGKNCCRH